MIGLLLGLAGCGASPSGGGTRLPQGELDQYFVGTQVIRLPDGTEQENGTVVAHRSLRPAESAILEEMMTRDAAGGLEARSVRLDVQESHFVLTEPGTSTRGEGDLEGEPWNWTAWHMQSQLQSGAMVVTDEMLSATDLQTESQVLGSDGTPSMVIRQVLTRVSRERYEQERAAIEGAGQAATLP